MYTIIHQNDVFVNTDFAQNKAFDRKILDRSVKIYYNYIRKCGGAALPPPFTQGREMQNEKSDYWKRREARRAKSPYEKKKKTNFP